MRHFRSSRQNIFGLGPKFTREGDTFRVSIPTDEKGLTGRQCHQSSCGGYFKIELGTGLQGDNLPCHCPYCGHAAPMDEFWTDDQIEYATSVAMRELADDVVDMLGDAFDFGRQPTSGFGLGVSITIEPGEPIPLHRYREQQLETELVCSSCKLHYAIFGVFGSCPDCSIHNSLQILQKNLELAGKELAMAEQADGEELRRHLIEDALENVVSSFDGFGRQACMMHKHLAAQPATAEGLSFQNIAATDKKVHQLFGFSMFSALTSEQTQVVLRCFQKRHVLSHRLGVIDQAYLAQASDPGARIGRRVAVSPDEVRELLGLADILGTVLWSGLTQAATRRQQGGP